MSRSLKHWNALKRMVDPSILAAGFVPEGRYFRRDVNDVSWFFEWGRPYDDGGVASVHPLVAIGSQVWQDRVGFPLPAVPGAAQFEAGLATLEGDWRAKGFPINTERWKASADQIVQLWTEVAFPFLCSVQNTDDLVSALRERPYAGRGTSENEKWAIGVWEGRIDPKTQPFRPKSDPLAGKEFTLDEIIAMGKDGA